MDQLIQRLGLKDSGIDCRVGIRRQTLLAQLEGCENATNIVVKEWDLPYVLVDVTIDDGNDKKVKPFRLLADDLIPLPSHRHVGNSDHPLYKVKKSRIIIRN